LAAVLKTEPNWSALPAETPHAIRRLLRRCLERDKKRRLSDIADARLEIEEALAAPAEAPAPPVPIRKTSHWWMALALCFALVALALSAVHFREDPPEAPPVRFQVPAPPKTLFGINSMALSPDGRKLAFIAIGAGGRSMLWLRPLDSVAAQPLVGTEGAGFLPFWSPDSRSIGFLVQGKLKKIDTGASYGFAPPQTLCEMPGSPLVGGSWSRDGVILFGTSAGGLWRVPQAGGLPTQVTKADSSQGEIGHLRPWFLPDGRHFLYVTRGTQANQAIYLASLDGTERKRLVNSREAGAYAPPVPGATHGHLLFMRDATLMAQTLDVRKFELVGEPFPIAEQVGWSLAMGFFSVSANGVLAYRSGSSVSASQLVWFNREGKPLGTLGPPAIYAGGLAFSPDGRRLAFDQTDSTGNTDIWVMDVARNAPTRFTFDRAVDNNPVWSPDGSRLYFSSDRNGLGPLTIFQKDASGVGNEQPLWKGRPDDCSPDGRYLLSSLIDPKTKADLWVGPAPGGPGEQKPTPYLQTSFDERNGRFSPDGHWIAYASDESGDQHQIYVQSFPIGAGKFMVSTAGGVQPRWRRDGKELFYIAADGKLMAVDVKMSPKFDAGTPKALFDPRILGGGGSSGFFRYDVTPDGQRFLVNSMATPTETAAPEPITVVLNWNAGRNH